MYIDTHTHLNFPQFDGDRAMVIGNAKKAGVKQFVVPGVSHSTSRSAVLLAKQYPGVVYAAVGFHPYEAPKNPDLSYLETLLASSPASIVAIGECGLDYHMYKGEMAAGRKDVQQRLFTEQLLLALTYSLPVIIHCRDAFEDVFEVFKNVPSIPRGVFHCFSGSLQDLRITCDLGFFIGIDGNVTYSKQLPALIPHIPSNRLLLETDAPYLTPVPHRGERNEPKFLPFVAQEIAKLQQRAVTDIMTSTTINAKTLFSI